MESITVADDVRQTPPTVLYAPTWVGPYADSTVYSLPVGVPIVQALLDRGCRVIFRAHPLNYRSPPASSSSRTSRPCSPPTPRPPDASTSGGRTPRAR